MNNLLKIKINNLYNTEINNIEMLGRDKELLNNIFNDNRFSFDEIVNLLIDDKLLSCMFELRFFKRGSTIIDIMTCDNIKESELYKFMLKYGSKFTKEQIEKLFNMDWSLSIDDIIWLLLCGGQPAALLEEIAVSVGKTLSYEHIFSRYFIYNTNNVNIYEFQNISEFITEEHLKIAIKYRNFDEDVLSIIMGKILNNNFSEEVVEYICKYQKLSTNFVCTFKDNLNWIAISKYQNFELIRFHNYIFFRDIKDYLIWDIYLTKNPILQEIYPLFKDKIDMKNFKEYHQIVMDGKFTLWDFMRMSLNEYNNIFKHNVVMKPHTHILARKFRKILLYKEYHKSLLDKLIAFFGCTSIIDRKLRQELKKSGYKMDGDYIYGYCDKDYMYNINQVAYDQHLPQSHCAKTENIYPTVKDCDSLNNNVIKVKLNIHNIMTIITYYRPKNFIKSITANKIIFIYD